MTAAAASPSGATVTYATPSATDYYGETDAVSCSPASGSTFALGVTTVTCATTDKFGNSSHSSFSVTVQDTSAPSVSISTPSNGATVSGSSVTLTAAASDSIVAVANLQFEVDGTDIGSAITSSPYTTTWNSTGVADGSHTLYAVAESASGNYATSSVSISVRNSPPVISVISSGSPTPYSATITWTTDEPATSQVNYGSTTGYGTASSSAALVTSHSITLTALTASTVYHFQVETIDGQGNTATSSNQTFTTPADTHTPGVSLTAPTANSTVSGASVTLTATASDSIAVANVQFKVDGTDIGSAITSSPYTTTWNSTGVADGSHTLCAVAENTAGNYATSSISVTVDNTPPVISAITPNSIASSTETITWTTNKAATSVVSFGLTTSYGSASSSAALVTSHSITLTGLTASTTYDFEASSADSQGNTATSSNQTFTTAAYNYYVDSVNGNDANPGTSPALAFQNITALPTITAGQSIGLADGSHWRQELSTSANNVTVAGYGSGALPIIDGSDIIPNSSFTKTAGYTNVYNTATITFPEAADGMWANAWETGGPGDSTTGTILAEVASEALVDSTACSYYIPTMTGSVMPSSAIVYIHSCDGSSPIANGYTYEIAQRGGLRLTGSSETIRNIEGRKNANDAGSINVGDSSLISGVIARDGAKHNVLAGQGTVVNNSTLIDGYYPATAGSGDSFLVFHDSTASGLPISFNNSICQSDQLTAGNGEASCVISHTSDSSLFGTASLIDDWAISENGTALALEGLGNITSEVDTNVYAYNLTGGYGPQVNTTITGGQYVSSTPSNTPIYPAAGISLTINGAKICASNTVQGFIRDIGANISINVSNSEIYLNSPGGENGAKFIYNGGNSGESYTFNNDDFGSNVASWIVIEDFGSGNTFSGGTTAGTQNIYESSSQAPQSYFNAIHSSTLAAWQSAISPADSAATESGGNAVSACTLPTIPTVN